MHVCFERPDETFFQRHFPKPALYLLYVMGSSLCSLFPNAELLNSTAARCKLQDRRWKMQVSRSWGAILSLGLEREPISGSAYLRPNLVLTDQQQIYACKQNLDKTIPPLPIYLLATITSTPSHTLLSFHYFPPHNPFQINNKDPKSRSNDRIHIHPRRLPARHEMGSLWSPRGSDHLRRSHRTADPIPDHEWQTYRI